MFIRNINKETMTKMIVEEEEEDEVWSSRTTPPPMITTQPRGSKTNVIHDEALWDPEDLAGIPEPPDGGWGWMIVAASFLCNTVVDGIVYSFGIFLMDFVRYYKAPKGKIAWVGSLLSGCYLSAGPLVSALTNRFGCRPVTMVGSVISTVAFLLSTMAPNVDILMVTYGIMGGIGFGLIYLPAIVSVGYYFSTKRAFATGIAVCGSGMGAFVFAPITQLLLDFYDWKGAMLIVAGFSLNCMVFGALMRPLKAAPRPHKKEALLETGLHSPVGFSERADSGLELVHEEPTLESSLLNTEPGVQSTLDLNEAANKVSELPLFPQLPAEDMNKSVDVVPAVGILVTADSVLQPLTSVALPTPVIGQPPNGLQQSSLDTLNQEKKIAPVNGIIKTYHSHGNVKEPQRRFTMPAMPVSANVLYPTPNNNYLVQRNSMGRGGSWSVHGQAPRRRKVSDKRDLARPLYRKDIFYSGSIMNLPEFQQSRNDVRSYVASVTSIPCTESSDPEPISLKVRKQKRLRCMKLPKSMGDTLKEVLDFSLLKEPPFLLACIANIFGMMGFYIPFVYITDSSIMKGISKEYAAFLLSIIGIANLVGRIIFGWVVDRPRIRALDVNNLCLTISGLATLSVPFCYSYSAIVAACTVFSLFISAYMALTSIILVDMLGLDKLTNSFGLLSLFRGAATIVGPPLAGTVFDITGSYDIPFYLAGGMLMISALLTFFITYLSKCTSVENEDHVKQDHSIASDTDSGKPESVTVAEVMTSV